jgi:hypothetical protein
MQLVDEQPSLARISKYCQFYITIFCCFLLFPHQMLGLFTNWVLCICLSWHRDAEIFSKFSVQGKLQITSNVFIISSFLSIARSLCFRPVFDLVACLSITCLIINGSPRHRLYTHRPFEANTKCTYILHTDNSLI